jgi:amino acid adenylation domain-containing protein
MVDDVVVLPYGTDETLEWLKANADGLAAVLVEPVQTRNPELHPREFLRDVRALTQSTGTVLIFDEMITGFRLGVKGAQGFYGVDADLATYGKVIGGGFPLGVVAGRASLMDRIDGGMWEFGDDSFPGADQTFFAGTFCKHPITMAAMYAVLRHIQQQGPAFLEELNARTARLVAGLRAVIQEEDVPIHIVSCASRFSFRVDQRDAFANLLFYHLLARGMYIWEGRGCFLSTAHSDEDCDRLVQALRESIHALREGGFLAERHASSQASPSDRPTREYPLTPAQRQIWIHAQLGDDETRAYNEQLVFGLRGRLDLTAMRTAVQDVMHHHEALRTVFDPSGDIQRVLPEMPLAFVTTEDGDPDRLPAALLAAAREIFDLSKGPLLRVYVHQRGPEYQVAQIVFHHMAMDALGSHIVLRDLEIAYLARKNGAAPQLPAAMQFSDYADLIRAHAERHADDESAWLARFEGATPLLLPTDRPRSRVPTNPGEKATRKIQPSLMSTLKEGGRAEGRTLLMTLIGALLTTLHRLADQNDIVVGIPSAGRPFPGADALVGHCVDLLPIRSRIGRPTLLHAFLAEVRRSLLDAYEHEVFALGRLTEKLDIPRGAGLPPLVSVVLNVEPVRVPRSSGPRRFADLEIEAVPAPTLFTKSDISFDVMEGSDETQVVCLYNADLFEPDTIARLLGYFERILEQIATGVDAPLSALTLLDAAERTQVVETWNRTAAPFASERCLHELFERQVERTPEAVAVIADAQSLRYRELNQCANQVAHHLRRLGVKPDVRVGLCLERSVDLLVAILGVLKAGGAYVPLAPTFPAERLAYMLSDAGVPVVVTHDRVRGVLPITSAYVVSLDAVRHEIAAEPTNAVESGVTPQHLAYVIYTSGSTGRPKGAMNTHGAVVNYVASMRAAYRLGADDVVVHKTPYSFDASVEEIFWSLGQGARLIIARPDSDLDPSYLQSLVEQHRVTSLQFVPSLLQAFMEVADPVRCASLRRVISGGEALAPALATRVRARFPNVSLVNAYGPTETAIGVSHFVCEPQASADDAIPIGPPMSNTQLYVLDRVGQPVPIGVPGELYVGGVHVGRGYLHRPGLTAERFVPDPFGAPGQRLYRTGDRVRWRADGVIVFLGRVDTQAKIHGIRIEVGEIEAVLRQRAQVRDCAVVAREDVPGDTRLVAYVVADADADTLRAHLRQHLPDYMVPAAFVRLESLPLLPSGKLDARALPAPDYRVAVDAYAAPRTPAEKILTEIWRDVLRLERVGIANNFFELGGDSIRAILVVLAVRRAGLTLSPRQIFEYPTIAELAPIVGVAREVSRAEESPSDFSLTALSQSEREALLGNRQGVEDLYPLSPMQEGLLFHALDSQAYLVQTAERLEGALDTSLFRQAWAEVVSRHAILRTAFMWEGLRRPLQRVESAVAVPWVVEDWRGQSEQEQTAALDRYLADDRHRGIVLGEAPLLRGALFRVADQAHWFVWSQHHLLMDGWSTSRIVDEVYQQYEAWTEGRALEVRRVRPYRDYIAWLQRQDQAAAERYWRAALAGITAPTPLGVDRPARSGTGARYAQRRLHLSTAQTQRLEAAARQWRVTLNTVIEGAWGLLLARYSGEREVIFGHTVAGRPVDLDGVEEMIGLFINTLPVRLSVPATARLGAWLGALQRAQAAAREYEYATLVQIQGWSAVPRGLPLFEAHLVYENYLTERSGQEITSGRLRLTGTRATGWATYPLSLIVQPGRGQLRLAVNYDERRFDEEIASRMLTHLERILEQIATGVDVQLSQVELLSAVERAEIVEKWNPTPAAYPADRCVHELFEAQAAATPTATATAMTWSQETLTYRELDVRANQMAHRLRSLGVGPDVRVGICMERSLELVVSLLAVLKAGGCYVPLEPTYPAARLAFMLVDAGVRVVITQERLRDAVPAQDGVAVVVVDDARDDVAAERVDRLEQRSGALAALQNLACVIYTSGSTGAPKGVAVPHSAVVRLVRNTDYITLTAADRVALASTISFDAATFEVWGALLNGATLVGLSQDVTLMPAQLAAEIVASRITTMFLTTALLNAIADERPDAFRTLRWLFFGGEAVDPNAVRKILAAGAPEHVLHVYGPTENTTYSTWHRVAGVAADAHTVPIGRAVAHSTAVVLDGSMQPVPVGVAGELYVGGAGLARGYLNRPALTADRFIPDPFGAERGGRLYRTGDRVRWRADGALEFLGRLDAQVKVHGFRIEPGEVEAALAEDAHVRQVRVIVREDTPGEKRLVAYVVATTPVADLRGRLQRILPSYMLPSAFVALDALPLARSGKLDVQALPPPDDSETANEYVAPRTPVEQVIAEIWADVLGRERVSVMDDFFALGGHSLLVMRLTSSIEAAFGVRLPIRAVFDGPTLEVMAADIERRVYAQIADMSESQAEQLAQSE